MAISYLRNAECYSIKGEAPILLRGDSTDEKPVEGIPANSVFEELDTGKKYYFDSGEWKEKAGSGGGGSDMLAADYDADGAVKEAGGIADYVAEHGGLPDPSEYEDGTVLIKVGNEWKAQSGYGYEGEPAFETITWDGDTTGKEAATTDGQPLMYKVSDDLITANSIVGSNVVVGGTSMTITEEYVEAFDDAVWALYVFSGKAGIYDSEALSLSFSVPEDGTYFYNADGMSVSSLTAPTVHTIDPKFIPSASDEFIINFTVSMGGAVFADKTFEEVEAAVTSGKKIFGKMNTMYSVVPLGADFSFVFERYIYDEDELYVFIIMMDEESEEPSWTAIEKTYTLTPASQEEQSV